MKNLYAIVFSVLFLFSNKSSAGMAYLDPGMRDFYLEYLLLAMSIEPTKELMQNLASYFSDSQDANAPVEHDVAMLFEDQLTYNLLSFPNGAPMSDAEARKSYVFPNEGHPEKIRAEREQMIDNGISIPSAAYVAVGTERGLLSAPIFEATHIVLVDNNAYVYLYNSINVALLQVSSSLADYIYLRFYADFETWMARLRDAIKGVPLDSYGACFKIWRMLVRQVSPEEFNASTGYGLQRLHLNDSDYFQGVNYLYDETLWQYLHDLAVRNCIHVYKCDLRKLAEVKKFYRYLKEHNIQIGVFDLSNAWWAVYSIPLERILRDGNEYGIFSSDPESCSAFLFTNRDIMADSKDVLDSWTYWLMPYHHEEWLDDKIVFRFKKS